MDKAIMLCRERYKDFGFTHASEKPLTIHKVNEYTWVNPSIPTLIFTVFLAIVVGTVVGITISRKYREAFYKGEMIVTT